MNNIYKRWKDFLSYPGSRSLLLFTLCVSVVQVFWLAFYHQVSNHMPFSTAVNLIFIHWQLPFPISRLWDLLLGPAYLILSEIVFRCEFFMGEDKFVAGMLEPGTTNSRGTLMIIALTTAFLAGCIWGVIYAVPGFVIGSFLFFVFVFGWLIYVAFTTPPIDEVKFQD